jgi:NADPH-dependent 2,4-dienoyl-CoA reductase/sulfur reductase-like enzyme
VNIDHFDMVVIGAGPAGLRATQIALSEGMRVALIDDNPRPGGQIWRQGPGFKTADPLKRWSAQTAMHAGLVQASGARVVAATGNKRLLVERDEGPLQVQYDRLILATGARERLLPFDGWTLPGVTGAGALQALIKGGVDVTGERIVIAGSGPLLLAAAATARQRGGEVVAVCERATLARVLRFGVSLAGVPGKLAQACGLIRTVGVSRYRTGSVVIAAQGGAKVEAVIVRSNGREESIECDRVANGCGLVPNTTLAQALGCELDEHGQGGILVDARQRTTVDGILAAGECTGVGGMELARAEGAIAAYAALGIDDTTDARVAQECRVRRRWQRFAARVEQAFEANASPWPLPSAHTLLCRCEDISVGTVARYANWRDAKLHTRCGMGACQGRICGTAAASLFGWRTDGAPDGTAPRPPISPARIGTLMAACAEEPLDSGQHPF